MRAIALACLVTGCFDSSAVTHNLVLNDSFEHGTAGWAGWGGTIDQSDLAHLGQKSARACSTAAGYFGINDSPNWVFSPKHGQTYVAHAWVRADDGAPSQSIQLSLRDVTSPGVHGDETMTPPTSADAEWQELSVRHAVTSDLYALDLYLASADGAVGRCFLIDDVSEYLEP